MTTHKGEVTTRSLTMWLDKFLTISSDKNNAIKVDELTMVLDVDCEQPWK